MSVLLDAALSYADRGWYVFPCAWIESGACSCKDPECHSPGKHPLTPHGLLDATNDARSVREFWTKYPKANIAIVTGAKSGIAVVDVDDIDVARPELRKLLPEYDFKSVPLQKTGKGWHLIFSYPGVHVKNGTKFLPGMDSRGDGGYIMAAPSRHISGNDYEWKAALNGSIAPLPAALLIAINGPSANSNGPKPRFDSSIVWEGISEGERDATLFKYASKMRGNDTPRDLADRLIVEASARCKPPFSERKALQKVEQAYKYPAGQTAGSEFVSAPREKTVRKETLSLQTWADFIATDHSSAPFTVDGIAPDYGLVAFHGRGKGGKTTLLIHGGRSIAAGETFLERATVKKPVVYINYEMGFSYLKELLIAGGPCPEEAFVLNRPEPILQIMTVEALIQQVAKPGVLIIDSFRGAFRLTGDAENSAGGAGVILRNLQDLAVKHRWLVIVVHHSNRSQRDGTDGVSGTSDWIAAPDVIWTWSRPDKNKPGVLHIEGRMPPVDPMAVELSPDKCTFVGSLEESQKQTDNKAIYAALTEEGQSSEVIAEMIGRPAGTVRKRLEALFDERLVGRDGGGKRGNPHVYSRVSFRTENPLSAETNPDDWNKVPR